jgi:hypothetical protein
VFGLQQVKIIPYFEALIVGLSGNGDRKQTLYNGLLFKSNLEVGELKLLIFLRPVHTACRAVKGLECAFPI